MEHNGKIIKQILEKAINSNQSIMRKLKQDGCISVDVPQVIGRQCSSLKSSFISDTGILRMKSFIILSTLH